MYESLIMGRSLLIYGIMFFLVEHIFEDIAYSQGELEHEQHYIAEQIS